MADASLDDDRIVPMEGGHNFRDIGGYPAAHGRHIARGLVFRSGTMSELSERDHAILEGLGLKVICDLRSTSERDRRPSRLPQAAQYEIWSRDHQMSAGDLTAAMRRPDATPDTVRGIMIKAYRTLAYEQAPSYRELFLRIARGSLPLVFHCAAGKDRTGIAAALLLELLGVPREQIFADYVMTDAFFARACRLVASDPLGDQLAGVEQAIWEPMLRADPTYLAAMFLELEVRHGSAVHFIHEELGLTEDEVAAIRSRLLV